VAFYPAPKRGWVLLFIDTFMSKYCPYCLPAKRRTHKHFHIIYYLSWLPSFDFKLNINKFWPLILQTLSIIKIVKFEANPNKEKLLNRSLIFFNEAQKRGIDIRVVKVFGKYRNDFRFTHNKKHYHYEGIPLFSINYKFDMDHKPTSRALLLENNIPMPKGNKFTNKQKALKFIEQIGFPVVIKPCSGSLSQHVTCNISSQKQAGNAIKIAKIYRPDFIVEKYIPGKLYRATVVGQENVFCCQREIANVTGNGVLTVKQLIEEKNKDKKRGNLNKKNTTLHKINIDDTLRAQLKEQGLQINTILEKDKKIYLHNKHTVVAGCDIIGVTDKVHIDNKNLFLKVASLLETQLVGIDFICSDISKSYKQQTSAVLETNSLPYIDMHQETSHGISDNVAEAVWDIILKQVDDGA